MKNREHNIILLPIYIIIFLFITISCKEKSNSNIKKDSPVKLVDPKEFIFSPNNSIYQVTFPQKPRITISTAVDAIETDGELAQLVYAKGNCFLKAEFIKYKHPVNITKEEIIIMIKNYSYSNGLKNAVINSEEISLGWHFDLRGTKQIMDENDILIPATYTANYYYKDNQFFILYAGSIAEEYPTNAIVDFYESIKLK